VASRQNKGTVFSTELRRVCPKCGWPEARCACATQQAESIPDRITARLRIERAGRRGKTVTVVDGLPRNDAFLKKTAKELKAACGCGGAAKDSTVELQGDHRDKLRGLLRSRGWVVKG